MADPLEPLTAALADRYAIKHELGAGADGRLDDAAEFYSQFLQMYDMPTERHQHLRDEAEAALERLAGERR